MTSFVFMWEEPDGKRNWEAVRKGQTAAFLEKLLKEYGVHPATVMVAYAPILFHWVWPEYHKGLSDVNFHAINDEIYGTAPEAKTGRKPIDLPTQPEKPETKYGWIAPDGRMFGCEYGGHDSCARKIVGEIQHISDPERFLEDAGWAKVFSATHTGKRYAVGMGLHQKLTDAQFKTLQRMRLDGATGVSSLL